MLSKSLVIFVGIGIISGLLFGIYLIDVKNTSQLVYVEGSGISVLTEKFDFKKGEEIKITIMNTGTVPLSFSDASYGLRVTGLSGILMYSPTSRTSTKNFFQPRCELSDVVDLRLSTACA